MLEERGEQLTATREMLVSQINELKSTCSGINRQILCNQATFVLVALGTCSALAAILYFIVIPIAQQKNYPTGIAVDYADTPCRYGINNQTVRWFTDQACPIQTGDMASCLTETAPKIFPLNFDVLRFICGQVREATVTMINGSTLHLTQQSSSSCDNDNPAKKLIATALFQAGSNIKSYELKGCDKSMMGVDILGFFSCLGALGFCVFMGHHIHGLNNALRIQHKGILDNIKKLEAELQGLYPSFQSAEKGMFANLLSWLMPKTVRRAAPEEQNDEAVYLLGTS